MIGGVNLRRSRPRKELPLWEREAGFVFREAPPHVVEKWEMGGKWGNGNWK